VWPPGGTDVFGGKGKGEVVLTGEKRGANQPMRKEGQRTLSGGGGEILRPKSGISRKKREGNRGKVSLFLLGGKENLKSGTTRGEERRDFAWRRVKDEMKCAMKRSFLVKRKEKTCGEG